MDNREPREKDDEPRSGFDIDIWGDGSPTNSTPIPEEQVTAEVAEDAEE